MRKYKTKDGELINISSPYKVVEDLRDGSRFDSDKTIDEFMSDMSKRLKIYDDSTIRCTIYSEFIEDLLDCGWLVVVPAFP